MNGDPVSREISLFDLWRVVWNGKFLIVGITGLCTVIAVCYALLATEWYRAEVLLVPAEDQSLNEFSGQLSGLAALAGVRAGATSSNRAEALAVLRSRQFAREFIVDRDLLSVFGDDSDGSSEQPDVRDAVRFFHENVLRVQEDRDTGLVTLIVEWTDPVAAAEWANLLARRLNDRMRSRASSDAEANIEFLRNEINSNNFVALEQSISRVMEGEMQTLMMARGTQEYAFRVVDEAEVPRRRSKPKRTFIVASVFLVSGFLSLVIVFVRNAIRSNSSKE